MRKAISIFILLLLPFMFAACVSEDEYDDSPQGNFEALWRIMDEHYCFFKEKGVDWASIHAVYQPRFNYGMSEGQQL